MQWALLLDVLNLKTEPRQRTQVAHAWERLKERKRILRMKPKPKDVDVAQVAENHFPASAVVASPL